MFYAIENKRRDWRRPVWSWSNRLYAKFYPRSKVVWMGWDIFRGRRSL